MRKFAFKLQTVLKVRRQTEKRQKQEYFEYKRRLLEELRRLTHLEAQVHQAAADARLREQGCFEVAVEQAYCDYLALLQDRIRTCQATISEMQEELERRLHTLIQARRGVKILEKLRSHQIRDYRQECRRGERRFFDEMALLRRQPVGE
jgi:flagellar protein FliJ